MAFDSLTTKLQDIFKSLRGKGVLKEADVKSALREVKLALLEADVNFKVVKGFIKSIEERVIGTDVLQGLNPAQTVIKIVNDELIKVMGEEAKLELKPTNEITVIMAVGLQGAGKTTTVSKLAGILKSKGRKTLLAACDVYRPAAVAQLETNAKNVGVEVYKEDHKDTVLIAQNAIKYAQDNGFNTVIIDTAGRLHIDEEMMGELSRIKFRVDVYRTILVADAMTGQDAVNAANAFNDKIGVDYVILTKLDGDTRGGAALSILSVTGKPIIYVGMGEKLSDLEEYHPDRMASRILGMGDVISLIEKVQSEIDENKARELEQKIKKSSFDFNDYLMSMNQMKKMGGFKSILGMLPMGGNAQALKQLEDVDDAKLDRTEAIILSMTKKERENPDVLNPSRKFRIAKGAGVDISEVNRLVKGFEQSKKMMKQMSGMMKGKKGRMKLPF